MQTLRLNEAEKEVARLRAIADESSSFDACVRNFQREGLSQGQAIDKVAEHKPEAYNEWCRAGRPAIQFVGR
jgi:hypothetical protein